MRLSPIQINDYDKNGFLLIPTVFSLDEIQCLIKEMNLLKSSHGPEIIFEKDKKTVRALMGCHLKSVLFKRLVQQSRILGPVEQLLKSKAYVYQFKINLKASFGGEIWPWHQDFIYWHALDGMPDPKAINATIFLDDCTEFNGPLWVIPESHKEGMLEPPSEQEKAEDWRNNVSSDLTYKLDQDMISKLVSKTGIASTKGLAGTILFFHPNIAHASLPNISPFERKLLIVTYNDINNIPLTKGNKRPDFLVNPNSEAEKIRHENLLY
jgi:ectoine hydroxylase-related dioxygenase (phytanoyl-CoA dioxygenase family)